MNELTKMIQQIEQMTPKTGSDYCMGYHTALMYVKKALKGENPLELHFNGRKITIEKADE